MKGNRLPTFMTSNLLTSVWGLHRNCLFQTRDVGSLPLLALRMSMMRLASPNLGQPSNWSENSSPLSRAVSAIPFAGIDGRNDNLI